MRVSLKSSRLLLALAATLALVAASLVFTPGTAQAGTAYGPYKSFSAGKAKYQARSWVVLHKGEDRAATNIKSKSGSRPSGHIGAAARGYKSNGALACSSGYQYNSGKSTGIAIPCSFWAKKGVSYYSKGAVKAWTGSKYKAVTPAKSPKQTGG